MTHFQSPARRSDPRRRSERAREAILDAAWELFATGGLRGLSIEAVAARAGVGKATIYRWWPGKSAVMMDALGREMDSRIPFADTGSTREDLRLQLRSVIELFTGSAAGRAYLALIGESQQDAGLAEALSERYIAARREAAAEVFMRGVGRGELRGDLDVGIAIDALYGAIYYRLLVSRAETTPDYAEELLDQLFPALRH